MLPAHLDHGGANGLGQQGFPVHVQRSVHRIGAAKQFHCGGHRGVGRPLGAANTGHLRLGLHPAPSLDRHVVDAECDPVSAKTLRDTEGKIEVDDRLAHAHPLGGARYELDEHLGARAAAPDQFIEAKAIDIDQLRVRASGGQTLALEHRGHDVNLAADLAVKERIPDRDRDLVAERGAALRVAEQQQVGHLRTLFHGPGERVTSPRERGRETCRMFTFLGQGRRSHTPTPAPPGGTAASGRACPPARSGRACAGSRRCARPAASRSRARWRARGC